ncbi:MAG: polysaccharide deacetylase family protein [Oscillospiraceae bacterium]|nr:polysaccharide deacetylase family protein [Oscillospiraceae bacterium]
MRNKFFSILLSLLLAASLTGCGGRNQNNPPNSSAPQEYSSDGSRLESDIGNDMSDLGSDIENDASDLVSDVGDGISDLGEAIGDGISDLGEGASELLDDVTGDHNNSSGDNSSRSNHSSSESSPSSNQNRDITASLPQSEEETAIETGASVSSDAISSLSNQKQGWGQGVQVDAANRPLGSLSFQEKYGKYDALFIGEDEKVVYLTFDEGYENGYTPQILDTLKEKNVKAVFFVTLDYVKSQPELIRRMIDEGHVIGNHSAKHPSFPDVTMERCEQEIRDVEQYLADNFGYTGMNLFRPPAGEFSERVLAQMQSLGYKTVFWSYAYKDWDPNNQMGADKALAKVNGALHNGAIYLLHAVSCDNAEILDDFIDHARSEGYEFKLFES